jgi:hypothetical protein
VVVLLFIFKARVILFFQQNITKLSSSLFTIFLISNDLRVELLNSSSYPTMLIPLFLFTLPFSLSVYSPPLFQKVIVFSLQMFSFPFPFLLKWEATYFDFQYMTMKMGKATTAKTQR